MRVGIVLVGRRSGGRCHDANSFGGRFLLLLVVVVVVINFRPIGDQIQEIDHPRIRPVHDRHKLGVHEHVPIRDEIVKGLVGDPLLTLVLEKQSIILGLDARILNLQIVVRPTGHTARQLVPDVAQTAKEPGFHRLVRTHRDAVRAVFDPRHAEQEEPGRGVA